ncbi:5a583e6d-5566-4cf2-9561-f4884ab127d6 [Thermothielavioides terrestris]|uniref:5a583e6d-5566-4cf2-9561-f4884ab127d6 n=1 Tax=Thermothielavioides terrestris TaxID=2587410 RepID=A0A446B9T1_9PEZI|nr:5a583e6d-5566-4cf2-9561-f4884ab127d6 [Thermothielavioides terrestris]
MTVATDFRWRAVIVNEAAALRNSKSLGWRMINALPKDAVGFKTATPAKSRVTGWQTHSTPATTLATRSISSPGPQPAKTRPSRTCAGSTMSSVADWLAFLLMVWMTGTIKGVYLEPSS